MVLGSGAVPEAMMECCALFEAFSVSVLECCLRRPAGSVPLVYGVVSWFCLLLWCGSVFGFP
ncbi:hypothetical protein TSUD_155700 [Trifolium subterraneum]|uniref:Uncharacterized protein n=1 Tax=Trifolium subterraneum TaxID=3900 RepID=A0A2Z6NIN4_TRISU|nr:hypothetical protein TSUD_155700 [Trifolium subterraneum]